MNKIRHEVRREKFRQIKEATSKPEYLRKALTKISGELRWIFEEKWEIPPEKIEHARKSIPPALLEATRDAKPPTGWRRKALILIYKTSLKELHKKSFVDGNGSFNFGKLMGLARDIDHALQKPTAEPEMIKLYDDIVMPILLREQDIPNYIKTAELIQQAAEQVPTRSLKEQKSFHSGLGAGINGLLNDDSTYTHGYNSTEFYQDLLVFDEYLECLHTRKQLHQFFIYLRGEKEAGKFTTFEKLCQNIGYLTPSQIRKKKMAQGKDSPSAF